MTVSDLIGVTQAAEILGYSTRKVKRITKAGKLEFALKMPGETGAYLFDRATIEAVAALAVEADEPTEVAS